MKCEPATGAGPARAIVLYDGVCNLCSATIRFIVRCDPRGHFAFAALQSEKGRQLLEKHGLSGDGLKTIVLIEGDRVYTRSDAGANIAKHLHFPCPALGALLRAVPRRVRDAAYDLVARKRYRWFGRKESCELPPPELKNRFL
jgi:predicted DCC family thiol-disulfide oxidoreductase YuxK